MEDSLRVEVGADGDGERADRALLRALEVAGHALTRNQLARAFEAGEVQIGGERLKPSKKLRQGDLVEVRLAAPPPLARAFAEDLPLEVLHEDEALLVVAKAPGMVVHASLGHDSGTLVNAVLHHLGLEAEALPILPGNDATRPGIVHRLDKDTSGVMVVAKELEVQRALAKQFAAHSIGRRYRAFCKGVPKKKRLRISTPHGRDPNDRRRFAPVKGATRRAVSIFELQESYSTQASELAVTLETGRTHQIRMHARFLGHPVLVDSLYGSRPRTDELREACEPLTRQALHAEFLAFDHPVSGERLSFEAELPPDLTALREALEKIESDS